MVVPDQQQAVEFITYVGTISTFTMCHKRLNRDHFTHKLLLYINDKIGQLVIYKTSKLLKRNCINCIKLHGRQIKVIYRWLRTGERQLACVKYITIPSQYKKEWVFIAW